MTGAVVEWTSGPHHGIAWRFGVALLDGRTDVDVANQWWRRLEAITAEADRSLGEVLKALAECAGTGLLELPTFAVAVTNDRGVHCAARGGLVVRVEAAGEDAVVSGAGVSTWSERHVAGVRRVTVGAGPDGGGRVLGSGVVPAVGLTVQPAPREGAPLAQRAADFISAVPGMGGGAPAPAASAPPAAPPPPPVRSAPAPPPVAAPAPAPDPAPSPVPSPKGDHDGETIRQVPPAPAAGPVAQAPAGLAPTPPAGDVLAVVCPSGHANPPQRPRCRICAAPLDQAPRRVPRPSLGRMVTSTGEAVELSGPVVVGRAPRASRFQGAEEPKLVSLPHPHISGSHFALRLDGWSVLARDLGSTNGTFLRRSGQPPFRLSDEPHLLVAGDVIDLGHGARITFEELP